MTKGWSDYLIDGAKITVKCGVSMAVPVLGPTLDLIEAGYDFYKGDAVGSAVNLIAAGVGFATLGISNAAKEVAKATAKGASVETAKNVATSTAKEATKKVGQKFAKDIAKGTVKATGKEAAIQAAKASAKTASKEATKKVGQQYGKDLAKGMIPEIVENVWRKGSKMTAATLTRQGVLGWISSGGHEVIDSVGEAIYVEIIREIREKIFYNTVKQNVYKSGTQYAAKKAASEAFKASVPYYLACEVGGAVAKGALNKTCTNDYNKK